MLDDLEARMDEAWNEALACCPEHFGYKRQHGHFPPVVIRIYSAIYRDGELTPAEFAALRYTRPDQVRRPPRRRAQRPVVTLSLPDCEDDRAEDSWFNNRARPRLGSPARTPPTTAGGVLLSVSAVRADHVARGPSRP